MLNFNDVSYLMFSIVEHFKIELSSKSLGVAGD